MMFNLLRTLKLKGKKSGKENKIYSFCPFSSGCLCGSIFFQKLYVSVINKS